LVFFLSFASAFFIRVPPLRGSIFLLDLPRPSGLGYPLPPLTGAGASLLRTN